MQNYGRPVVAADDEGNVYREWNSEADLIADVSTMSPEELELHFQQIMDGVVRHYEDDRDEREGQQWQR